MSPRASSVATALGRWLGEVIDMALALTLVHFVGWAALAVYVVVRLGWLLSVRLVMDGHVGRSGGRA